MTMPWFVTAIFGGFLTLMDSLVGRVLISLGFSFITYQGFDTALTAIKTMIIDNFGLLPPTISQIAGLMKVGTAISIIFSAYAARLAIDGLTGGVRRLVQGAT